MWKKAGIGTVFKKGSRAEAANYRLVSLTSIACKTLEDIACSHARGHADTHDILGEEDPAHQINLRHAETTPTRTRREIERDREREREREGERREGQRGREGER